jgi:GNAT superfamily N-acetyltransferase
MPASPESRTVLELEELALNAWPARSVLVRDGWLLRLAGGYTKRANSVHMLQAGHESLADKIAWAESRYAADGQPAIFRLTPLAPDGIEERLAERGYDIVEPSLVQVTRVDPSWRRHDDVVMTGLPDPDWTDAYACAAGLAPGHRAARHGILAAVAPPAILAHIERHGRPVAFGMAVVERGHVGFFDMLTSPDLRRQGLGRRIMESLFAWARDAGATTGTLQVVEDNAPARALYASFGFRSVYGYRYRVGPAPETGTS